MGIFKSVIKSDLAKNISILSSGTIIAQFIPIALQPFLRRQFSAADYGAYSVYLSLVGILIIIASFKYELAIILPGKKKEAANVLFLALLVNLVFTIFLLGIVFLFNIQITNLLNLKGEYQYLVYFIPLGTLLYNAYQSINYWLIREKQFLDVSKNKIIRRTFEGLTQSGFSILKNSKGLLWGDILGNLANLSTGIYQSAKKGLKINYLSIVKLKYVAKKYSEYPKVNLLPSLMSAISFLLPVILVNKFFSTEHAGYFDLSRMVLSIPLALIASSVSNVLLQKIDENYKQKKSLFKELRPLLLIIFSTAITEIFVICFFGEELFAFVFGNKNLFSGTIAEIMVWSDALSFISASFTSIYIAMKKIKLLSIWQVSYFAFILILFFMNHFHFIQFLKTYMLIKASFHFISVLIMFYIVLQFEKKISING